MSISPAIHTAPPAYRAAASARAAHNCAHAEASATARKRSSWLDTIIENPENYQRHEMPCAAFMAPNYRRFTDDAEGACHFCQGGSCHSRGGAIDAVHSVGRSAALETGPGKPGEDGADSADSARPAAACLTDTENARYLAECEVRRLEMVATIAREMGGYRAVHFDHAEPVRRVGDV